MNNLVTNALGPNPSRTDPMWVESVPGFIDRDMRRWTAVGQGFQYTAYVSKDEVLKVPLTLAQTIRKGEKFGFVFSDLAQVESDFRKSQEVMDKVRQRLLHGSLPSDLLADARVSTDREIRQSLVVPFGKAFAASDHLGRMELLASYGNCLERTTRAGAFETGFALLSNYGVDRNGRVVVMDFGELTFDKTEALKISAGKVWASQREAVNELEEPYKTDYLKMMQVVLDPMGVEQEWNKRA